MTDTAKALAQIIADRCSYRGAYLDTPIPREHLRAIMQAGLDAPSGCNMQTTSLIAVDDAEKIAAIRACFTRPIAAGAPAFICVLAQEMPSFKGKSYHVQDYSAAIENMLLMIRALGYDSCWYEGYMTDADAVGEKIAALLDVPPTHQLVCLLPVGIAAEERKRVRKKDFAERAWFNGFWEIDI
ncbi:MAG: nitroreductase family protein [Firmicutes bacterium]|nr:nitroreductase family protein [Bacillota bacterium]